MRLLHQEATLPPTPTFSTFFLLFSPGLYFDTLHSKQDVLLCVSRLFALTQHRLPQVSSPAWLGALLTAHSLMWMFACTAYRLSVWLKLAEPGDRYTNPCCSSHGQLSQDSCRQMDGPVDTNPLREVMELARVCELLPCHSWLTDWPT